MNALEPEFSIRQASYDEPKLKEIIDLSFPRFFCFFALHRVSEPSEPVLVAEAEGKLAGFAKVIH